MASVLDFPQEEVDRIFTELGELRVELDDDPLVYGPKRLNTKTACVRRMLDRCETLFLDVSRRLQAVRRALRVAEIDLDLAKKDLFANDPETRSGRSVSDREAIAAGKLNPEIMKVHDLTLAATDLESVLVVIRAKRADLKDTEGRLRDQIRLCSEEIGLGSRWGSKVPGASEIYGGPARKTATGEDIEDVNAMLQGIDGEIQLARSAGQWQDPPNLEEVPVVEVPQDPEVAQVADALMAALPQEAPASDIDLDAVPSEPKDLDAMMPIGEPAPDVDVFLAEIPRTVEPPKMDSTRVISDVDVDNILSMFEAM